MNYLLYQRFATCGTRTPEEITLTVKHQKEENFKIKTEKQNYRVSIYKERLVLF